MSGARVISRAANWGGGGGAVPLSPVSGSRCAIEGGGVLAPAYFLAGNSDGDAERRGEIRGDGRVCRRPSARCCKPTTNASPPTSRARARGSNTTHGSAPLSLLAGASAHSKPTAHSAHIPANAGLLARGDLVRRLAAGTCQRRGVLCPSGIVLPPLNGSDQMGAWTLDLVPPCAFWVNRWAPGTRNTCNIRGIQYAAACVARLLKRDADVGVRPEARDLHVPLLLLNTTHLLLLVFHTYHILHPDPL